MDFFLLKKLVSRALFPLPLCLGFMLLGFILLRLTRRKKTGYFLLVSGAVLLLLFSNATVSRGLLRPLEYAYPAFHPDFQPGQDAPMAGPVWICVAGSAWTPNRSIPLTSRMDPFFAERMLEAARVSRMFEEARLVVCMASPGTREQKQAFQDAYAELTGIAPRPEILVEVINTESEIVALQKLVGETRTVMVSSASHMPRVMALCRRHGVRAEAAPCGHRTLKAPQTRHRLRLDESYPNAASLARSERAVYEYLGNAWEGLKTWWFSLREGPDK